MMLRFFVRFRSSVVKGQILQKKSFSKDLVEVDPLLIFLLCIDKTFFKTFFHIIFKTPLYLKSRSIFDKAAKLCKASEGAYNWEARMANFFRPFE